MHKLLVTTLGIASIALVAAAPADAAYVGDSPYDMRAANAAGMTAIGVTWGKIHDREALSDADVVVDTPEELLAAL